MRSPPRIVIAAALIACACATQRPTREAAITPRVARTEESAARTTEPDSKACPGNDVRQLLVDGDDAFFRCGDGTIRRRIIPTGEQQVLVKPNQSGWLVVDAANVYFDDRNYGKVGLFAAPRQGGPPVMLTGHEALSLASDAHELWFTTRQGIYRMPAVGGMPTLALSHENLRDIAITNGTVVSTDSDEVTLSVWALNPATLKPQFLLKRGVGGFIVGDHFAYLSPVESFASFRVDLNTGTVTIPPWKGCYVQSATTLDVIVVCENRVMVGSHGSDVLIPSPRLPVNAFIAPGGKWTCWPWGSAKHADEISCVRS